MLGIDISDKSIKVAETIGEVEPRLRAVAWVPVEAAAIRRGAIQDPGVVTQQLGEAFARSSPLPFESRNVVASIPEMQSFVRVVELPQMNEREMGEAVRWAVKRDIPFDLDSVYLDWQSLATPARRPNYRQVLVGAAQQSVVNMLLRVLDGFQLNVMALELEAQSIVRSLMPLYATEVRGVLIVDLGATSTKVVYFDQGSLQYTISIPTGGDDLTQALVKTMNLPPEVADQKKATVGVSRISQEPDVAAALRAATSNLIEWIAWVTREMAARGQEQIGVRAIVLSGGAANLPGIVEIFAEIFAGVPVQMGNPWTNFTSEGPNSVSPLSPADASHFATALGLALRPERINWQV